MWKKIALFCWFSTLLALPEDNEIWVVEEEFVQFGKSDAYKTAKKSRLYEFQKFTGRHTPYIICVDDIESNQFLYLTPVVDFAAIEDYFKHKNEFQNAFGASQETFMRTFLNFTVDSIHRYKKECSYSPAPFNMLQKPYLHVQIISLMAGMEAIFEQILAKKVAEAVKTKSTACWRTWQVLFGSDIPKYAIGLFAATKEELADQMKKVQFIDASLNEMVRAQRTIEGIIRPELSLVSE